ncbi:hypothetical protein PC111_g18772 [Phytophthora cactorum]|nr:hypothetical protein PC111_g18772 [Phytophthora cactorum]
MPKVGLGSGPANWHFEIPGVFLPGIFRYQLLAGTTDTGHTKACEATRSGLVQPGSRRRCATHKDVGGDANVNANLGSNGVLANFQLAAGQLEVHASGGRSRTRSSCISSSNMTDTRMSTCSTASREGRDQ